MDTAVPTTICRSKSDSLVGAGALKYVLITVFAVVWS